MIHLLPLKGESGSLIPILRYHSVDSSGSCHSTPPEVWESHIQYLQERDFSVLSIRDYLMENYHPSRPAAIMTFDDGYRNNHDIVLPVLHRFNMTATFYCVTGYAGKPAGWVEGEVENLLKEGMDVINGPLEYFLEHARLNEEYIRAHLPQLHQLGMRRALKEIYYLNQFKPLALMSRHHLLALHQAGMEIGAHTDSHCYLSKLLPKEASREILNSKHQLEEILQAPVDSFCFPYGDYSEQVVQMVKEAGFKSACGCESGYFNPRRDSLFELPRIGMELVKGKFHLDFYLNWKYRKMLNVFWTRRNV